MSSRQLRAALREAGCDGATIAEACILFTASKSLDWEWAREAFRRRRQRRVRRLVEMARRGTFPKTRAEVEAHLLARAALPPFPERERRYER